MNDLRTGAKSKLDRGQPRESFHETELEFTQRQARNCELGGGGIKRGAVVLWNFSGNTKQRRRVLKLSGTFYNTC